MPRARECIIANETLKQMFPTAWTRALSWDQQGVSSHQAGLLATALYLLDTCWVPGSELDIAGRKIDQTWSPDSMGSWAGKGDKVSKDLWLRVVGSR